MKNLTIDFLHSELNRISEWVRFVDTKVAFLSIAYTVSIGYMISLISFSSNLILVKNIYYGLYFLNILLILTGVYILFICIFPKINNKNTDESLFFYERVGKMKYTDFARAFGKLDDSEIKNQLIEQIHTNSTICSKKMGNVRSITKIFFIVIGLLVILSSIQYLI